VSGLEAADAAVTLDAFYALPDHGGSGHAGLLERLADGGLHMVEAGRDRWELRAPATCRSRGAAEVSRRRAGRT
jgi:hypothetical protein